MNFQIMKKVVAFATAATMTLVSAGWASLPVKASYDASPWGKVNYVNEAQTKLVHLDYADYVVISFAEGTIDDYNVYLDGVKINEALSKVDDAGTIVKWHTTVVKPGKLQVLKKDAPYDWQTIAITEGNPYVETKIGSVSDTPDYFLARGTISTFDYYLNPKDKDGNDRVLPSYTTFDLQKTRKSNSDTVTTKCYIPEVKMDDEEIIAEFSVENDAQKTWFEGIHEIKLANQDNMIINGGVNFSTEMKASQYGINGIIHIPTGQDNMNDCGIYQLNIHSTASEESVTVPFEILSTCAYKIQMKTIAPKVGEQVKFTIEGENGARYGSWLGNEQKKVTMTKPSGKTVELKNIDEWGQIGEIFSIYDNCMDEAGVYQVSVKYSGYPEVTTRFEVFAQKTRAMVKSRKHNERVDAVSRATSSVVVGGGGKPSSGGVQYQGKFVINYDLITNALLLAEIGESNEAAKNVVEQFNQLTEIEYVYKEGAEKLYSYRDYSNAFLNTRLAGREALNFTIYCETATASDYAGPGKIQNMLENGSYGYLTDFKFFKGKQAPSFSGLKALKGENFVLRANDKSYVKAITALYVDGLSAPLRSDPYQKECEIDRENGIITIYRKAFNFYLVPEEHVHTLRIETESGYRNMELKLQYVDELPMEEVKEEPKSDLTGDSTETITEKTENNLPKQEIGGTSVTPTPISVGEQKQKEETKEEITIQEEETPLHSGEEVIATLPRKVFLKGLRLKNSTRLFVEWKKLTNNCKGYQIQIATKKTFQKDTKVLNKHTRKTSYIYGTLKKGTYYYVRVRAYNFVNGKNVYGAWSGVKKIKR